MLYILLHVIKTSNSANSENFRPKKKTNISFPLNKKWNINKKHWTLNSISFFFTDKYNKKLRSSWLLFNLRSSYCTLFICFLKFIWINKASYMQLLSIFFRNFPGYEEFIFYMFQIRILRLNWLCWLKVCLLDGNWNIIHLSYLYWQKTYCPRSTVKACNKKARPNFYGKLYLWRHIKTTILHVVKMN